MTEPNKITVCPYCGETQPVADRCRSCRGLFEPLSLQATQNDMGPWSVYEPGRPFRPGCSYEMMARKIERGHVTRYTVLRGPTTRQFWTVARHVPGIAHLLGYCHACDAEVDPDAHGCHACGVPFGAYLDRNHLGLQDVQPLPGEAPHDHHHDGYTGPAAAAGISSFASDEELVATMTPRTSTAPHAHGWTEPAAHAGNGAQPAPDVVGSPLVRSLQRRLAQQQRTIRFLTGLVVVVALAGTIITVIGFSLARGPADDTGAVPGIVQDAPDRSAPARRVDVPEAGPREPESEPAEPAIGEVGSADGGAGAASGPS